MTGATPKGVGPSQVEPVPVSTLRASVPSADEPAGARQDGLREAAIDALAGWRYIRQVHGDLYGVGWDRVEQALVAALSDTPDNEAKVWRVACWDADEALCEFSFTSRAEYDAFMAGLPKGVQVSEIHEGYQHTAAYALEALASPEAACRPGHSATTPSGLDAAIVLAVQAHRGQTDKGGQGRILATGHAEEYRKSSQVNKTSALENAETSAIGRALAAAGWGGTEFASANEVQNAIHQQESQPSGGMPDDEFNRLIAKIKTAGVPADKLQDAYGVDDLRHLNQTQYAEAMKRLDKTIADKAKAQTNEQAKGFADVDDLEFAQ